jgi:hypothetical protein
MSEHGVKLELVELVGMVGNQKSHHMFEIKYDTGDTNYGLAYIKTVIE